MRLSVDNATPYLVEKGLVDAEAIVAGDLRVTSAVRRNRNLRVEGRPGYLVKQPDPDQPAGHQTLAREAAFYRLCQEHPAAAEVAALLPRLKHHEPAGPMLFFELFSDARSLHEAVEAHAADAVPTGCWHHLGDALGTFHKTFQDPRLAGHPEVTGLPDALPWILSVARPHPDMLGRLTAARNRTLRILQTQEELSAKLAALVPRWRLETLIHGDVKSDNVLVLAESASGRRVRLIDWEMVQRGDAAWDVAGVLQDVLYFWIRGMSDNVELSPAERVGLARYPLPSLQPAVRAFWQAWQDAAGQALSGGALDRAVAYSGARLIQTAYELSTVRDRLPVQAVLMLQIASNVLAQPQAAARDLFGLQSLGEGDGDG